MGPETKVTPSHRREIIFELIQELENMKVEFVTNKTRLALIQKIQNEKEIIDELVAWGHRPFETLKRHNVAMTPNLQFFHREFLSCYSSITRKLYTKRKAFKKSMLSAEQVEADLKAQHNTDTKEYEIAKRTISTKNTSQMGVKIALNSGYGAIGNRWFKEYYDPEIARAITASGELINKWVSHYLTQDLRAMSGHGAYRFIVYGDTDSLVFDTIININGKSISIGDFYNSVPDNFVRKCDETENYVKRITTPIISPSVNKSFQIENNQVTHVMKHKVKKRMFSIKVGEKEVTVTADHSLMVKRDNKLVSVKPTEIVDGDVLLTIE